MFLPGFCPSVNTNGFNQMRPSRLTLQERTAYRQGRGFFIAATKCRVAVACTPRNLNANAFRLDKQLI
jgi:hypothetical protein